MDEKAAGFLYLVAIMGWHTRKVLSWRISNTLEAVVRYNRSTGSIA